MITTSYDLPFAFHLPAQNPWDGERIVDVTVQPAAQADSGSLERITRGFQAFWNLGGSGALAGEHLRPAASVLEPPISGLHFGAVAFRFERGRLDERATNCLVSLALAVHGEAPLRSVRVSSAGITSHELARDAAARPYPGLWPKLPFAHEIDDSENDTRVLRLQFVEPIDESRSTAAIGELTGWANAVNAGAFGIAPLPPNYCDCMPERIECDDRELIWPLYKCRFHPAALDALVALCAAVHERIAPIEECLVE